MIVVFVVYVNLRNVGMCVVRAVLQQFLESLCYFNGDYREHPFMGKQKFFRCQMSYFQSDVVFFVVSVVPYKQAE